MLKNIFIWLLTAFFLISAISLDVSAAKKAGKLSKEAIQTMSDDIDAITKKIYGRALLSPQDNEKLIGIKIQLDNQMLGSSATELAPLYFKAGNVYKLRGMVPEAADCYKTIVENFADTALAPKARAALEEMGIKLEEPAQQETSEEEDEGI